MPWPLEATDGENRASMPRMGMGGGGGGETGIHVLCDELLADILRRVQGTEDQRNISMVCRRWLKAQRFARKSLTLLLPQKHHPYSREREEAKDEEDREEEDREEEEKEEKEEEKEIGETDEGFVSMLSSLLLQHPYLEGLSVLNHPSTYRPSLQCNTSGILEVVSLCCRLLRYLYFASGPPTLLGLTQVAAGCPMLVSLHLASLPAKYFPVLKEFNSLTEFSLKDCNQGEWADLEGVPCEALVKLERLEVEGLGARSAGMSWLWRSCPNIKRLKLLNCHGIGDTNSASFSRCLSSIQEIHLSRCRSIATAVLLLLSEIRPPHLRSLTLHDGGNTEALQHFLLHCGDVLEILDLRLPLDLDNEDLESIGRSCPRLKVFRLYSCWLVNGVGIRLLASHIQPDLEELALVRCRAIVQYTGTLNELGQRLPNLRILDLSDNERLCDIELLGIIVMCRKLFSLKLWQCRSLTDWSLSCIAQNCSLLQCIDIRSCDLVTSVGVATLISSCPNLRSVLVEKNKLGDGTSEDSAVSRKGISIQH